MPKYLVLGALLLACGAAFGQRRHLQPPMQMPAFKTTDMRGNVISDSSLRGKKLFIMFMRNVNCPMCNLRLHELRNDEALLQNQDRLQVVVFLQSPDYAIRNQVRDYAHFPFPIVPDSAQIVYARFGAERNGWRNVPGAFRFRRIIRAKRLGIRTPIRHKDGGVQALMPCEFLVNPDGRINTAYYGADQGDTMPLEIVYRFMAQ